MAFLSYFTSPALRISAGSPGKTSTPLSSSRPVFSSYRTNILGSFTARGSTGDITRNRPSMLIRLKFVETQKYLHPPEERDCKTWFEDWLKYEFNSQLYNLGTAQTFENEYAVLTLRVCSPFTCRFGQSMIFLATKCE